VATAVSTDAVGRTAATGARTAAVNNAANGAAADNAADAREERAERAADRADRADGAAPAQTTSNTTSLIGRIADAVAGGNSTGSRRSLRQFAVGAASVHWPATSLAGSIAHLPTLGGVSSAPA
jgi:hypothetical protein